MWGLITISGGYLGDYLKDALTDALTGGKERSEAQQVRSRNPRYFKIRMKK